MDKFGARCHLCGRYTLSWIERYDGTIVCDICYNKKINGRENAIRFLKKL